MMPARERIVVCETVAAIVLHLREVGDTKINYNGNAHGSNTLCGSQVGWDTRDGVGAANCQECLKIVEERQAKTDAYVAKQAAAKRKLKGTLT